MKEICRLILFRAAMVEDGTFGVSESAPSARRSCHADPYKFVPVISNRIPPLTGAGHPTAAISLFPWCGAPREGTSRPTSCIKGAPSYHRLAHCFLAHCHRFIWMPSVGNATRCCRIHVNAATTGCGLFSCRRAAPIGRLFEIVENINV